MSADLLREAAAKMRERAEGALLVTDEQPWRVRLTGGHVDCYDGLYGVDTVVGEQVAQHCQEEQAEHIASWHPAVALAVADWLDYKAGDFEDTEAIWRVSSVAPENTWAARGLTVEANLEHHYRSELAVARAYLGRP